MGTIPYGLTGLLKEGYKLYSGINDVVQKNIDACRELSNISKTSIGPNGEPSSIYSPILPPQECARS